MARSRPKSAVSVPAHMSTAGGTAKSSATTSVGCAALAPAGAASVRTHAGTLALSLYRRWSSKVTVVPDGSGCGMVEVTPPALGLGELANAKGTGTGEGAPRGGL